MQRWWLHGRLDVSIADVEEALAWLIERGLVERRMTGTQSIYRVTANVDRTALAALADSVSADPRP